MKKIQLKYLSILIFIALISFSCTNNVEEVTLEKVYYEAIHNNCDNALKWIGASNPNFHKYTITSNADMLVVSSRESFVSWKTRAINEHGVIVKTDINLYGVIRDQSNGNLYERTKENIYTIDRESYTKTLLAQSESINTVGSTIIDDDVLYTTKINNDNQSIEIISFDLQTYEASVIHQETNPEDGFYANHLFYGTTNGKRYLVFRSENENSTFAHAFSLDENQIAWSKDIGKTQNTSRWVRGGNVLMDATFDYIKAYDMETGNLISELPIDGNFFEAVDGDYAIISKSDKVLVINLRSGRIQEIEGKYIHCRNSLLYMINDDQFAAFDLKANKRQFCTDLTQVEGAKNMIHWKATQEGRYLVGTIAHCDAAELFVLKY